MTCTPPVLCKASFCFSGIYLAVLSVCVCCVFVIKSYRKWYEAVPRNLSFAQVNAMVVFQ